MANNLVLEGVRIGFRNFEGKAGKFNNAGNRNFCVFIDDLDLANKLGEDGWNIRYLPAREEGDPPRAYLQVKVRFDPIPPKIVLVSSKGKKVLDETNINILDWAEIQNVDIIIRPYNWHTMGGTGIAAYVQTMYVTIVEDEIELKYSDLPFVPDSAQNTINVPDTIDQNNYPF